MNKFTPVVFLFSGLWLIAQQPPRVQGPKLPPRKGENGPRLLPPRPQTEVEGYENYHGTPTHSIHNCIPGKVRDGRKGQTKNVPCECLDMVEKVQTPKVQACDEKYERDSDRKAWMACREEVPHCSQIVESGHQDFWGIGFRFRCQTYCKDQNCECCDDGRKDRNQARHHGIMMAHMLSLQPGLRPLLPRDQACREARVVGYNPLSPAHLFYGLAVSLLRD